MSKEELKEYVEYIEIAIRASIEEYVFANNRVSKFSTAYNIDTTRPKIDKWLKNNVVGSKSFTESFSAIHTAYENYHDVIEDEIKFLFGVLQKMLLKTIEIYPENDFNKKLEKINKILKSDFKPTIN